MYQLKIEPRLDPPTGREPVCPVCGREASTFYKQDGEIIGCDECIRVCDAWEEIDEGALVCDLYEESEWKL